MEREEGVKENISPGKCQPRKDHRQRNLLCLGKDKGSTLIHDGLSKIEHGRTTRKETSASNSKPIKVCVSAIKITFSMLDFHTFI